MKTIFLIVVAMLLADVIGAVILAFLLPPPISGLLAFLWGLAVGLFGINAILGAIDR